MSVGRSVGRKRGNTSLKGKKREGEGTMKMESFNMRYAEEEYDGTEYGMQGKGRQDHLFSSNLHV